MFALLARTYFGLLMVPSFAFVAAIRRLLGTRLGEVDRFSPSSWSIPGNEGVSVVWLFFVTVITLPLRGLLRLDLMWGRATFLRDPKRSVVREISPFIYQMH
jgi:hypothetical protein